MVFYVVLCSQIFVHVYVYVCINVYILTHIHIYRSNIECKTLGSHRSGYEEFYHLGYTRNGQNNGNTKKLRNRICVGCVERTSVGNIVCSSVCLHSVVLVLGTDDCVE
jgi:hypothetical protein